MSLHYKCLATATARRAPQVARVRLPYRNRSGITFAWPRSAWASANLRNELQRAGVVGGGVAQRILELPADPVHAPVITRRRAARRARRYVRPRRAAVARVLEQCRHARR